MKKPVRIEDADLLSNTPFFGKWSRKLLIGKLNMLETIVCNLDAVIFIHDLRSNRHIWTKGNYRRLIGYENGEIRQIELEEARGLFNPDDMKIILEGKELLRSGKADSFSGIYRIRHKEGHWVWIYCSAGIIQREKNGDPSFALGFAVDFSPHIHSEKQLNELIAENRRLVNCLRLNCLTRREKEVITHLAGGHTCKEISNLLGISYFTTETHIRNIHCKLGLTHLSALVKFALESGLSS